MFGGTKRQSVTPVDVSVTGPAAPSGAFAADIAEARRHYQSALDAQRNGDWAKYGEEIKALGQILDRVSKKP